MSGMPGPSSTTFTSMRVSESDASSRPPTEWMTTFISASYAAIMVRRMASASAPMRLRCSLMAREAAPARRKSLLSMS